MPPQKTLKFATLLNLVLAIKLASKSVLSSMTIAYQLLINEQKKFIENVYKFVAVFSALAT